eukprot:gnl/MRDRNA2_/MRDRNA2_18304_c0_seq1.p1 gnl/MRDRNA2_/MRDRNA2_18304_c0~~gnl/MRDRNA2_/MRDRNA2_18304_c0_seq1.p1  ORF type:complete len:468 (+),score=51.90 gnl/MRDRNA2_/MRDRNA2_18304_c0_seq1:391-1794(+)
MQQWSHYFLSATPSSRRFFCVTLSSSRLWAGLFCFVPVLFLWSIEFIAKELEGPFGRCVDDLDLEAAQNHMNECLITLLNPNTQWSPDLDEVARSPKCLMIGRTKTSPQLVFLDSGRITKSRSDLSSKSHHSRRSRDSPISVYLDSSRMTRSLDFDQIQEPSLDMQGPLNVSNGEGRSGSPSLVISDDEILLCERSSGNMLLATPLSNNESLSHLEPGRSTRGGMLKPRRRSEPDLRRPTSDFVDGPQDLQLFKSDQQRRRYIHRLETILSQPEEAPTENGDENVEDSIVTQRENQSRHDERTDGTPKGLSGESTESRKGNDEFCKEFRTTSNSRTSSTSNPNNCISKLNELLQNNHQCLALFEAGGALNDVDVHHAETSKLPGRFDQVEADQQLSHGQSDSSKDVLRMRYSKNSTYSKASTGSDQVTAIEGHVSVQLPASLPMPVFCRDSQAPRCRSQSNQSRDAL